MARALLWWGFGLGLTLVQLCSEVASLWLPRCTLVLCFRSCLRPPDCLCPWTKRARCQGEPKTKPKVVQFGEAQSSPEPFSSSPLLSHVRALLTFKSFVPGTVSEQGGSQNMAVGQNPVPPVNIPIPTKIKPKMGDCTYPKIVPLVVTTTAIWAPQNDGFPLGFPSNKAKTSAIAPGGDHGPARHAFAVGHRRPLGRGAGGQRPGGEGALNRSDLLGCFGEGKHWSGAKKGFPPLFLWPMEVMANGGAGSVIYGRM